MKFSIIPEGFLVPDFSCLSDFPHIQKCLSLIEELIGFRHLTVVIIRQAH